ncbi:sporulation integral membrane protein YtvI [Bacillus salitolerans]|uniref:Sporulation integral membrane protein YtvI n=1 Tax=Bacillus salitolerans TaxID=1437434 RepID=A0ABW4LPJ5_9BACI
MNSKLIFQILRFLFVLAIIIGGAVACYYLSTITYPFIIALVIAYMINPLVNIFEKKVKMPRTVAVFVVLILAFGIIAGLLTLLIAEIINGSNYLAANVPQHFEKLVTYIEQLFAAQIIPFYNQLTNTFENLDPGQKETILSNIESFAGNIIDQGKNVLESILSSIPQAVSWIPNAATVIIFALLATFFISKDWYNLSNRFSKLLPKKARESGKSVFTDLKKALFGFIKAQATLISITTVIVLIGLLFLRVEYAITIALLIGIVDVLPYLGTGLVFVPWIVYSFFTGDMAFTISLLVLYIIIIVQRQIMEPKILSSSIGLDPLATLVSLFVGFKLFGFLGLIIGPVTLVIIKTLHSAHVFQDIWSYIIGKKEA